MEIEKIEDINKNELKNLYIQSLNKWKDIPKYKDINRDKFNHIFSLCPFCIDVKAGTGCNIFSVSTKTKCHKHCKINSKICGSEFSLLNRLDYYNIKIKYSESKRLLQPFSNIIEKINKLISNVKKELENEIIKLGGQY